MILKVSALGHLKKFLPEKKEIAIDNTTISLKSFASESLGIPPTEPGVCFIVNGRLQKNTYQPVDNDEIVILKMGGAG